MAKRSLSEFTWWRELQDRFPVLFPDRDLERDLDIYREEDGRWNEETSLPPEERVDLHCLWAVEFYTPSHSSSLIHNLDALGWGDELGRKSPSAWIQSLRDSGGSGGWFNLGRIVRPGKLKFLGPQHVASLPEFADHALGEVFNLTSSLTCVVIAFVLTDEASQVLHDAISGSRQTYKRRAGKGYALMGPYEQKRDETSKARAKLRKEAADWFRVNLPGVFASGGLDGEFATCEFVTLRRLQPYSNQQPAEGVRNARQILTILNLLPAFQTWEWSKHPQCKFAWSSYRDDGAEYHGILSVNESMFTEEMLRSYGGLKRSTFASYMTHNLGGLVSAWGLLSLLNAFELHLNRVRDSTIVPSGRKRKLHALLSDIESLIVRSADISLVCAELKAGEDKGGLLLRHLPAFRMVDDNRDPESGVKLHAALVKSVVARAALLEKLDRSVRELVIQYSSILEAREGLALQQTMRRLTWATVILAIIAVVLTSMLSSSDSDKSLLDQLRTLF